MRRRGEYKGEGVEIARTGKERREPTKNDKWLEAKGWRREVSKGEGAREAAKARLKKHAHSGFMLSVRELDSKQTKIPTTRVIRLLAMEIS